MPWLYNCAFPVVTMEEQNGLGFVSPIGWFEPTHNAIKTICRESKCKSRAELAKLAWAIMPRCSFAYSKKKRWVLCVSNHQSVILVSFFSLCLKRGYRKKGKIGWCIGLHLEGSSPLRWTIRSPFKTTVHFYREHKVNDYIVEVEEDRLSSYFKCSRFVTDILKIHTKLSKDLHSDILLFFRNSYFKIIYP